MNIIIAICWIVLIVSIVLTGLAKDYLFDDTDWMEFSLLWVGILGIIGAIVLFLNLMLSIA